MEHSNNELTRSILLRTLTFAAESVGSELNWEAASDAVRQVCGEVLSRQPGAWTQVVIRAGEQIGLRFRAVERPLEEIASQANPRAVWFTMIERGMGLHDVAAVVDHGGYGVKVRWMAEGRENESLSMEQFKSRISGRPVWLVVESFAPLAQADAHQDEHVWHGLHPYERLKEWMRAERHDLWVAVVYSAAVGILSLVVPIATQSLVNTIAFGMVLQPLLALSLLVLLGLSCAGVLLVLRMWVVEILQRRVFVRIATDVVFRLLKVRIDAFDKGHGPELVNRFFEVVTVQKSGATLIVDGLTLFMTTLVGLSVMAAYDPILLGFDFVLLLCMGVILFPMSSGALPTAIKESKSKYALAAWLEEIARHPVTFKSASGSDYALERADTLVSSYLTYRTKHFKVLLRQKIGTVILQAVGVSALLGVGGFLVINNRLTIGQLIAAELIVTTVLTGVTKFTKQLETFYDLLAAVDKLGYFTDLPLERSGHEAMPAVESPSDRGAHLHLSRVTFGYEGRPRPLFDNLDFDVPAGARIGLMSRMGNGKSSLLDLVYGLRAPLTGVLEFDGRDYRELRLGELRGQMALVRSPEVFHGTVADNVRLGGLQVGTNEVREALEMAGLLDDVQSLPDGINTELATGGLPLSSSQVIRLMLARAVVNRPRVLILDEILDRVDDPNECAQLADRLFDSNNPWTMLIASSRTEVLTRCTHVYGIADGRLVEAKDQLVKS